ncbi:MAG: WD40 repeat domain-containing protein [Ignavibacteriales bacterium]|nr:WD40 repeat domain-containing protein [Ignavibacteriales bacterium]
MLQSRTLVCCSSRCSRTFYAVLFLIATTSLGFPQAKNDFANAELWVGHTLGISAVALSPDDSIIASVGDDGALILWSTARGKQIGRLEGQVGTLYSVAFDPSGQLVAAGGWGGVELWNVQERKLIHHFPGYFVQSVFFSPDGNLLTSWSIIGEATVWRWSDARVVRKFKVLKNDLPVVALNPLDSLTKKTSEYATIGSWAFTSETVVDDKHPLRYQSGNWAVWSNARGGLAGIADERGELRFWDIVSGKRKLWKILGRPDTLPYRKDSTGKGYYLMSEMQQYENTRDAIQSVSLSANAKSIFCGGYGRVLRVVDILHTTETQRLKLGDQVVSVVSSRDGKIVVAGTRSSINIVHSKSLPIDSIGAFEPGVVVTIPRIVEGISSISLSPDGSLLAIARENKQIAILDLGHERTTTFCDSLLWDVKNVSLSHDGKVVAFRSDHWEVVLWDIARKQRIRVLSGFAPGNLLYHPDLLAYSPDGKMVASVLNNGIVKVWDPSSGNGIATLEAHKRDATALAFSPDGKLLATGGYDRRIVIWDLKSLKSVVEISKSVGAMGALVFAPDGKTLAGSTYQKPEVKIWDVKTGVEVRSIPGLVANIVCIAYSPDGKLLAIGNASRGIALWNVAEARMDGMLEGHKGAVRRLCFSSRGQKLFSAGADGKIYCWDVGNRKPLAQIVQFGSEHWVVLTSDGHCDGTSLGLSFVAQLGNVNPLDNQTFVNKMRKRGILKSLLDPSR